jgi:hypothetical protein
MVTEVGAVSVTRGEHRMGVQQISPGSVVARVWEIYRDYAGVLLGTALVLFAVQFVVYLVLPGGARFLIALLFWVLSTFYQGMVVRLVQDVQDGRRDSSVGDLLESVSPVVLPLMAVALIFGICVGIGFVLIIIPGLILMTIWAVVAPVCVLERPGVFASFGRSRELVRGNGWNVFGVIVIVYLAVVVVSLLAGIVATSLGPLGRSLVQWVVNAAVAPITAVSAAVLYFALRGLRERPAAETAPEL